MYTYHLIRKLSEVTKTGAKQLHVPSRAQVAKVQWGQNSRTNVIHNPKED